MSKFLLIRIHLYCGLFTVFYLIAFGFSSIVLNHNLKLENADVTHVWSSDIAIGDIDKELDNRELAEYARNELGLMGWTPFWLFKRDSISFQFSITHPGRNYRVNLDLVSGKTVVEEVPKGFLAVLNSLHFLNGQVPNAPGLIKSWAAYQWLALLTMLVSLFLGLWLWIKHQYRSWEGLVFGGIFGLTVLIMFLI